MKEKIGSNYSGTWNIPSGVTQDSVLGPLLLLIFINDLPNEIKVFANDGKLFVWSLSKETTQIDINKLSYGEDIWKLRFNIEKNVKYDVPTKVIVEYDLSIRKIKGK